MLLKDRASIIFSSFLFMFLMSFANLKAEAVETFAVMDIISRVDVISNLDKQHLKYFHNARDEIIAEFDENIVIPGKVEIIDFGDEFKIAALQEQEIMAQLGSNSITQTKYQECNYVIFLYLTNCNTAVTDKVIEKNFAVKADVSARIVDKKTGKCVLVTTGSGVSRARDYRALGILKFKTFECPEDQFYDALKQAVHEVVLKIKERMKV